MTWSSPWSPSTLVQITTRHPSPHVVYFRYPRVLRTVTASMLSWMVETSVDTTCVSDALHPDTFQRGDRIDGIPFCPQDNLRFLGYRVGLQQGIFDHYAFQAAPYGIRTAMHNVFAATSDLRASTTAIAVVARTSGERDEPAVGSFETSRETSVPIPAQRTCTGSPR